MLVLNSFVNACELFEWQQLVLTFMLTSIIVYLYTVIAFNFFRKFYVQEDEEGEEPDYKCHDMFTVSTFPRI